MFAFFKEDFLGCRIFVDAIFIFKKRLKEGREINKTLLAGKEELFPGQQGRMICYGFEGDSIWLTQRERWEKTENRKRAKRRIRAPDSSLCCFSTERPKPPSPSSQRPAPLPAHRPRRLPRLFLLLGKVTTERDQTLWNSRLLAEAVEFQREVTSPARVSSRMANTSQERGWQHPRWGKSEMYVKVYGQSFFYSNLF